MSEQHDLSREPGDAVPHILRKWLSPFRFWFTVPSWEHLLVLVMGELLSPGKRTVTACLRITGRAEVSNFAAYHQLLNRARWNCKLRRMLTKLLAELAQRQHLNPIGKRKNFGARIDDDPSIRREVLASVMEAALDLRGQAPLHLDGPFQPAGQSDDQVDFGAGRASVEIRLAVFRQNGMHRFNCEAFSTGATDRVTEHVVERFEAEERMDQAGITNVNPRRFHEPFSGIAMPGFETPHEQEIHQGSR